MGKIAIWILVAIAVMLLLRLIGANKRRGEGKPGDDGPGSGPAPGQRKDEDRRDGAGELMMSCAVCGIHIPASDAVFARGKVFCGPEHRDRDVADRDGA